MRRIFVLATIFFGCTCAAVAQLGRTTDWWSYGGDAQRTTDGGSSIGLGPLPRTVRRRFEQHRRLGIRAPHLDADAMENPAQRLRVASVELVESAREGGLDVDLSGELVVGLASLRRAERLG